MGLAEWLMVPMGVLAAFLVVGLLWETWTDPRTRGWILLSIPVIPFVIGVGLRETERQGRDHAKQETTVQGQPGHDTSAVRPKGQLSGERVRLPMAAVPSGVPGRASAVRPLRSTGTDHTIGSARPHPGSERTGGPAVLGSGEPPGTVQGLP